VICVAAAGVALVLVEEVKLLVYDLCRVKANQAVLWPGLIMAGCWSPVRAATASDRGCLLCTAAVWPRCGPVLYRLPRRSV
jgi:hypothetical protein